MDKWQVQDAFWRSFGLPAYDMNSVPADAQMPYITYEAVSGNLGAVQTVTASLWYRSRNWKDISNKTDAIEAQIKSMKPSEVITGGRFKVRIPEYTPFAQRMSDPDEDIKRVVISVEIEFLT